MPPSASESSAEIARDILPLFRTRNSDLWQYRVANNYGVDAHDGVWLLKDAVQEEGAAAVYPVVVKAIASTVRAILHADDSSGIIGDAVRRLLVLHAELACEVQPPARPLVDWLMRFHFDGTQDFFEVEPADYVEALGDNGMAIFRAALDAVADQGFTLPDHLDHFKWVALAPAGVSYSLKFQPTPRVYALRYFAERFAVLDKDGARLVEIIAGGRGGANIATLVASALVEIGDVDGAITWARNGAHDEGRAGGHGIFERRCATLWCELLAQHRPEEEVEARRWVVQRFPTSTSAAELRRAAGKDFGKYEAEVEASLQRNPDEYVTYLGWVAGDVSRAWGEAKRLGVTSPHTWERLCTAYGPANPAAVIPVLKELVDVDLEQADARQYRIAVKRLKQIRSLSLAADAEADFEAYVADLREEHRRRPRLQQEFTRAGL